jgi:hypothetical protein
MLKASYILPIKLAEPASDELSTYLRWLRTQLEVIVVDGSSRKVFEANGERWPGVTHVKPDHRAENGKVAGVLTGLPLCSHDRVVIADDDVRYDAASLRAVLAGLKRADIVRPQNYYKPLPWHAWWDTGRMLLNRATDGDWPGTLAVRRSFLEATQGYDGDCLFENLELVRTVRAAGGRELVARDVLVRRLPPSARHFWSQRVRQAYDELARPVRLSWQLALLPASLLLALSRPRAMLLPLVGSIALAEAGRRRGGTSVFPVWTSLAAPLWLTERAICSWLAVGSRLAFGGIHYHGRVIARAATPQRLLDARHAKTKVNEASSKSEVEKEPAPSRPRVAEKTATTRPKRAAAGTRATHSRRPAASSRRSA